MRRLVKEDLFFLCWFILGMDFYNPIIDREDYRYILDDSGKQTEEQNSEDEIDKLYKHALRCAEFPFNFCKRVEKEPNKLWLVARGHLKSLTITTALNIQDILKEPEISIAIISYNLGVAKSFLKQIKYILETNVLLRELFPDVLYQHPQKQSTQWNEQDGINVKRKTTRKEPSFYAFGLVDSQKTGFHSDIHSFDDVVTENSVTSEDMINKTTERWELSDNLGMMTEKGTIKRYAGTRYHLFDTYSEIIDRGTKVETIPATDDGTMNGKPIFLSEKQWEKKKIDQGSYVTHCQNLLNPKGDKAKGFNIKHLEYFPAVGYDHSNMIKYILVDPANAKKKTSDYSCYMVIGTQGDGNIYLLDIVRDRLNPTQRIDMLFELHREYKPLRVGYEEIGLMSDVHNIKERMKEEMYHFRIEALGGRIPKEDRIRDTLQPLFEARKIFIPVELMYENYEKKIVDLTKSFKLEYTSFPVGKHDDMLDALARIRDINLIFPQKEEREHTEYNGPKDGY
jgi:predicted phage terminase large subunit-like protein